MLTAEIFLKYGSFLGQLKYRISAELHLKIEGVFSNQEHGLDLSADAVVRRCCVESRRFSSSSPRQAWWTSHPLTTGAIGWGLPFSSDGRHADNAARTKQTNSRMQFLRSRPARA